MSRQLSASVRLEIPFHDVDSAGIVWHGHYAKYFEIARCALLKKIQYNYDDMMASGLVWPITDLATRFLKPAFFDQIIDVKATLVEWDYRIRINYLVTDQDGNHMTRATTDQVPMKHGNHEMQLGSPEVLMENVAAALQDEFGVS
jgi:acyl-CoA thioester hydrolase